MANLLLSSADVVFDYTRRDGRLDRSKIVVVANSSVAWSLPVCQYYCSARGIPLNNIVSVVAGTDRIYNSASNAAAYAALFAPVISLVISIGAVAVLTGPAMPDLLYWTGYWDGAASYVLNNSTPCTVSVPALYQHCMVVNSATDLTPRGTQVSGDVAWYSSAGSTTTLTPNDKAWKQLRISSSIGGDHEYQLPTTTLGWTIYWPTPQETQYINTPHSTRSLLTGRIGIAGWNGTSTETEAAVRRIIDNATLASSYWTSRSVRQLPILVSLKDLNSGDCELFAQLGKWLRDAGYNVKWAYGAGFTPNAATEALLPAAGSVYADYTAQTNYPYYQHYGYTGNDTPALDGTVWKGVTVGSGGCMWPSFPFQSFLKNMEAGTATAAASTSHHINTASAPYNIMALLMRGFSYLEAIYYSARQNPWMAAGDPLYAPFAPETLIQSAGNTSVQWRLAKKPNRKQI